MSGKSGRRERGAEIMLGSVMIILAMLTYLWTFFLKDVLPWARPIPDEQMGYYLGAPLAFVYFGYVMMRGEKPKFPEGLEKLLGRS